MCRGGLKKIKNTNQGSTSLETQQKADAEPCTATWLRVAFISEIIPETILVLKQYKSTTAVLNTVVNKKNSSFLSRSGHLKKIFGYQLNITDKQEYKGQVKAAEPVCIDKGRR